MSVEGETKPWYRTNDGCGLVVAYVAVVLFATVVSTGLLEAIPALDATAVTEWVAGLELELLDDGTSGLRAVPPFVYLASAVGALTWGLRAIVNAGDQSETGGSDSSADPSKSTDPSAADASASGTGRSLLAGEPRELLLRPFAALPLAAGVYLLIDSAGSLPAVVGVTVPSNAVSTTAAVLGLFAGLFLHRTYERLGRIADALRDRGGRDAEPSSTTATGWYRRPRGTLLVAVYFVAAVVVLVATASNAVMGSSAPIGLPIPVEVYLYALLGVMGRIFTELIRETDIDAETLALRAVRIPLAMLLAGAVYLLLQLPSLPGGLVALPAVVLAFLVGLYEGVGFHYLSVASERLLPTARDGEPSEGPSSGELSDAGQAGEDESSGEPAAEESPEAETSR